MEKYDYLDAVMGDVKAYYEENAERYAGLDVDELAERLSDDCWANDSVTGNGSGSYTFSRRQAEENLCHNLGLLYGVCEEFGSTPNLSNPEGCDVTIRCYLLPQACQAVAEDTLNSED